MISKLDLWQDKDKRRALLLSLVVHLSSLLLLAWFLTSPKPAPKETFIVIDIGTPALAEVAVEAPAAAEPAPQAATPQVAAVETGEPQNPEGVANTPSQIPEAPPAVAQTPEPPQPQIAAPVAVPTPQVRVPEAAAAASAVNLPSTEAPTSSVLPEIDEVVLEPKPLAQAIRIPTPSVSTEVPQARIITATPNVQLAPVQSIPQPSVQASVAIPQPIAQPQPQLAVATPQNLPQPQAQVTVATARPLDITPNVNVSTAQTIPAPQIAVAVAQPQPQAEPNPVSAGDAEASTTSAVASPQQTNRPAGANADQAGQTSAQEGASTTATGAAASPEGAEVASGAPAGQSSSPYRDERNRPIAVLLDNVSGYPQTGLLEASAIYEMPVEGGLTRLMTIYDRIDPSAVGPVRSARDYFLEAARNLNGILVHDGGSPSAIAAIERGEATTLNAFNRGDLFSRDNSRNAPYNLYSSGNALRQAINRLNLNFNRVIRSQVYRPAEELSNTNRLEVAYSGSYNSGFRYISEVNLYRWQRQGQDASDAYGEAVMVDAVVVAAISEARAIPDDPEGRLYIPLRGGEATLYLRGKIIPGRWSPDNGFSFISNEGIAIDLRPFKYWVMFAPPWSTVQVQ